MSSSSIVGRSTRHTSAASAESLSDFLSAAGDVGIEREVGEGARASGELGAFGLLSIIFALGDTLRSVEGEVVVGDMKTI